MMKHVSRNQFKFKPPDSHPRVIGRPGFCFYAYQCFNY